MSLSVTQVGDIFAGTYVRFVPGDSPVYDATGSVKGDQVSMVISDGRTSTSFFGTLDGDTLSGATGSGSTLVLTR